MSDRGRTDGNTDAPKAEPWAQQGTGEEATRSDTGRSDTGRSDTGGANTGSSDSDQDNERYRAVGPLTERDRREKQEEERKQREAELGTSWVSVIFGWITSLGATLLLAGIVGGIVGALFDSSVPAAAL